MEKEAAPLARTVAVAASVILVKANHTSKADQISAWAGAVIALSMISKRWMSSPSESDCEKEGVRVRFNA